MVDAGETADVLITGLPPRAASLVILERLELRASLASAALAQRKRSIEERRRAARHRKLLDSGSEAAIFLDAGGLITDLNRGAKILRGQSPGELAAALEKIEPERHSHRRFSELFCAREHDRIEAWLQGALAGAPASGTEQRDSFEAELVNGVRARIRAVTPAIDDRIVVLLEAMPPRDAGKQQERAEAELRNVLEWVEEGVLLFDENQNIRAMKLDLRKSPALPRGRLNIAPPLTTFSPNWRGRRPSLGDSPSNGANSAAGRKAASARNFSWPALCRGCWKERRGQCLGTPAGG